ncbi:MAG TPA: glycosyltransferase family 2 protein [Stellaceae bacterium]|nr:glycosyltransferase family 2 protein [Stellaceae bacterium]
MMQATQAQATRGADRGDDISVVMITMNEEKAVGKVIADIKAALPGAEIVIVDSSRDATPDIAQAMGARVIRQFPPKGYGRAMDLALRSFTRAVGVTMDCDDTYPVDRIGPMARMVLDEGFDLVDGSRLERKPEAMPWLNYLANWGFALAASALFGQRLTDLHSGMRAYRKGLVERLGCDPAGPALPVDLLLRTLRQGFRVKPVFIAYRERIGVSTMRPLQSAWWTGKRILGARFSPKRPLLPR